MFTFEAGTDPALIKHLEAKARNLRPAYINSIPGLVKELVKSFPTQGQSINAPWAPLRDTWARRKKSTKILEWQGELEPAFTTALQYRVSKSGVFIHLPRKQMRRMAPAVVGNEAQDIPPRELFGWTPQMSNILADAIMRHLNSKL